MNPFVLAAVIVTGVAFLLELLCIALPFWLWYETTTPNFHYYVGLFDVCHSVNNDRHTCATYTNFPSFWKAMEAMEIIAFIVVLAALIVGLVALICRQRSGILHIVAGILDICTAVFGLIAVIVFGAKYDDGSFGSVSGSNIHASFYIALFAVVFAIVGAIFFFIGKPRATVKDFD